VAILENFVLKVGRALEAHDLESLLAGTRRLSIQDLGNEPEAWTEKNLIFPVLSECGLDWDPRPSRNADVPDFEIRGLHEYVVGENKPPNDFASALRDIKRYLRDKAFKSEFGIATDGLTWGLYRIDLGSDFPVYSEIASVSLREAMAALAARLNLVGTDTDSQAIDEAVGRLIDVFSESNLDRLVLTCPQHIQEEKNRDVEDFFDLYSELVFGRGKRHHYETRLLDDIIAPAKATEEQKRLFAICLVNRLFFIRFLEGRVLPEGFLRGIVQRYREVSNSLASSLYESQIKPLFYRLFNTPKAEREQKFHGTQFDVVPYLNGGLFRPSVPLELEYDVRDRILPVLITDLIEGHELRQKGTGRLDPAILGHVFEKAINFISSETGTQEDLGAFYTPGDVTRLVTARTVDLWMRDAIAEVFARRHPESKSVVKSLDLHELLSRIAARQGWFGDPSAIEEAYKKIGRIRVLDPACGSGHFLTTVMEEVHRARLPMMNALGKRDPKDHYESKKELAMNSIYGVDVVPSAVEIAKLRIWLKIIEEGWSETYGELPNIDFNIVAGNSLFGLPVPNLAGDIELDVHADALEDFRRKKEEYKAGRASKEEVINARARVSAEADEAYVRRLDCHIAMDVSNAHDLQCVLGEDIALYPRFEYFLVKSDASLGEDIRSALSNAGFRVHAKSARLQITFDYARSLEPTKVWKALAFALDGGCRVEISRKPEVADLSYVKGRPFHWSVEFSGTDEGGHLLMFDVVLGNPPYGNILTATERALAREIYRTGSVSEIAAQFLEREIELLAPGGYLGNVVTLRVVYQETASVVRDLIRTELRDVRIACFASRPSKLFDSSDPRIAILTGVRGKGEDALRTSEFIRFRREERSRKLKSISYESAANLELGERIGDGHDFALPKVGSKTIRTILLKLKDASKRRRLGDAMSRGDPPTEFVVWRKRGPRYWINPYLECLHPEGSLPSDFEPMHFASQLERDAAFLLLQSSLFYLYWMAYGDERHLNWKEINAFAFPDNEFLEAHATDIHSLAEELWTEMKERFEPVRGEMRDMGAVKPLVDRADALFAEYYGFTGDETSLIVGFHSAYRRGLRADEEGDS